jgi:hypothetical protein
MKMVNLTGRLVTLSNPEFGIISVAPNTMVDFPDAFAWIAKLKGLTEAVEVKSTKPVKPESKPQKKTK